MLDLGTKLLASVARDPDALAIVDGPPPHVRGVASPHLGARAHVRHARAEAGDHLVTFCRIAGRRRRCIGPASSPASSSPRSIGAPPPTSSISASTMPTPGRSCTRRSRPRRCAVPRSAAASMHRRRGRVSASTPFERSCATRRRSAAPRRRRRLVGDALYLGHHGAAQGRAAPPARGACRRARPRGAELYRHGERTLGVMPLYHTMGVRSLLAMSLIGGTFVCLPRFDAARALELIAAERITNLYLVPTLYHDLVHPTRFAATDVSAVRKLGFAGASMTDGLLKQLTAAFKPDLFVNHYGSSEIYTFTIDQNAPAKPGSAGRAGINQMVRVVRLGAALGRRPRHSRRGGRDHRAARRRRIVRRLLAPPRRRCQGAARGLVLHRRHRIFRCRRRPVRHRPRRRHDHHRRRERLAGRDRELPVAASGGVGGSGRRPSRRPLGPGGHGLRQAPRRGRPEELDRFCRTSALAPFKRPRRYVFVAAIPKSPVGKLLRRKLVAGEYEPEGDQRELISIGE